MREEREPGARHAYAGHQRGQCDRGRLEEAVPRGQERSQEVGDARWSGRPRDLGDDRWGS